MNSFIYWTVWKNIKEQNEPQSLTNIIAQFENLIFEDKDAEETPEEIYLRASNSIDDFVRNLAYYFGNFSCLLTQIKIDNSLESISSTNKIIENGTKLFLEAFQYPIWNKHVREILNLNKLN